MKIDDVLIKANIKIQDKVKKVSKGSKVKNSLLDKNKDKPYDLVMVYCNCCQKRLDVYVYHSLGKSEHFQLINLPEKIAKHLKRRRKIDCPNCNKTFILEKHKQNTKSEFLLKLDCSNMRAGMESWYEDSIPKEGIYA
jgi:hypothetical protein